jgi:hypothetical protein
MLALTDYLDMLRDEQRVDAYRRAIAACVKPGDYVIELGAGPGYFSVLAAQAGAARVDAVDVNPTVHLASRLAQANGVGDIVHAHQCDALQFDPGRRAQVILGDLRGVTPFFGRAVEVFISARQRLLDGGGQLIAQRDRLYCAPCRDPKNFADRVTRLTVPGVQLSTIMEVACDTPLRCQLKPDDLLATEQCCGVLDYRTVEQPSFSGEAAWSMTDDGEMRGIALWFETELTPEVRFSTRPGEPWTVYGQLFLPLRRPLVLDAGDHLSVTIRAVPAADNYLWQWSVRRSGARGIETTAQNSLAARVIDPRALKRLC